MASRLNKPDSSPASDKLSPKKSKKKTKEKASPNGQVWFCSVHFDIAHVVYLCIHRTKTRADAIRDLFYELNVSQEPTLLINGRAILFCLYQIKNVAL